MTGTADPRPLAELRAAIWAMRPETLSIVRGYAAGAITDAQARAELGYGEDEDEDDSTDVRGGVAVISLHGVIRPNGGLLEAIFGIAGGLEVFRRSLRDAVNDPRVAAIVLDIDSPGGVTSMVPETATEVFAARAVKPVVAVANTMAASAAYWIGSQADEFVVTPSGDVGSIGIYCAHEDWSRFDDRLGVKTTLISAGPHKVEGNPFEPLSDEARAAMQGDVDAIYEDFLAAVAQGRGATVDEVREGYGQGRCLLAHAALDAGLVDGIATLDQVVVRLLAEHAPEPDGQPALQRGAGGLRHAAFPATNRLTSESPAGAAAAAGGATGIAWVEGEASVYGSRNTFGEVFVPGAFQDAASAQNSNPLPMVDMHRTAIGSWVERLEDIQSLSLAGPISDTQPGRDAATLLEDGAYNGLSVGFLPLDGGIYLAEPGESVTFNTPYGSWSHTEDRWTLYVLRARLAEVSLVYAPSDDKARVTGVRSLSAEQIGTALPGLKSGAAWDDVAWSMCRLMGAPGGGLTDLQPAERQALYERLAGNYAAYDKTPPAFTSAPQYRGITFHDDEPSLYQDRSLGKRCADVAAAIGGMTGRPLSDGTRTRAAQARDAINQLLEPEQPEDTHDFDPAAVSAELERALTSLES